MTKSNKKKKEQLGLSYGTASHRLKKAILFQAIKKLKENFCYQCGSEIENVEDFSIEHKIPYLDSENPKQLFYDLENIAFSHLLCNTKNSRRTTKILNNEDPKIIHGIGSSYNRHGCRCELCKQWKSKRNSKRKQIKP